GGAADAGVPEFIDDWLDFEGGELVLRIREGLTALDAECMRQYGAPFAGCERKNQQQILDRIAWPERAAPQDDAFVGFFSEFRDLVLSGFYTSETGIRYLPYLGNEPQQRWQGCPASVLERLALVDKNRSPAP
ncbi:MAG: gluconate 2-dehydrogenase subunit 3 family protein, partial [Acidobacteriota bacterium]